MAKHRIGLHRTQDACKRLGISRQAFFRRAATRGIEPAHRVSQVALWTPEQIKAIAKPLRSKA